MKVVWIVLGVLAFLGLACCGGMFFLGKGLFQSVADANDQADKYSAQILPQIAKSWDYDVVQGVASPEFKEQVKEDNLRTLLALYKEKLGAFKSVGEFTASNTQAKTSNGNSLVIVTTNATAQFEKGAGAVKFEVVKRGEDWKLLAIEIESEALRK
ncbi:MAG: DUF3887 domain-containing protein [Chlorobia bacterium]|nr:DUF3887 domain-containing protein [Fimbriimonadaceae bacterium]